MYPRHIVEQQARAAEQANERIRTLRSRSSTSDRGRTSTAIRMVSPISQGYVSDTSTHDSDRSHLPIVYLDNPYDFVNRNPPEEPSTPIELPPIDLKIEHVEENYSEFNTESQAGNDEHDPEEFTTETVNNRRENRKRKRNTTDVMQEQAHHMANNVSERTGSGHSSQENDDVITIEDDGIVTAQTSSQNAKRRNGGTFDTMLDEYREITKMISKYEDQLERHKKQEDDIRAKLAKQKKVMNERNLNATLDNFRTIALEIANCEEQLKQLNKQESIIRLKLNHSRD